MPDHPFSMTIDLNVLNHLGINLYSNNPAVLAEAVANTWDADAQVVSIDINRSARTVVIADDGHGMTADDINAKFLRVGRSRRRHEAFTPEFNRPVMGRKGIGKLSLFSIADTIEVQSAKDGERSGFVMSLPGIKKAIEEGSNGGVYYPDSLPDDEITVESGTHITLRDLRKGLSTTETHLRRRLARRFSIIGATYDFSIIVNGTTVGIEDRHYYPMLQFIWYYGPRGEDSVKHCKNIRFKERRTVNGLDGWIGTVDKPSQLKDEQDSLNKIVLMARGKLVQEDILEGVGGARLYTKYLIGELQADGLDVDDDVDIATTSRQAVVEDDPRVLALKTALTDELRHIRDEWTKHRNQQGKKAALESVAIKAWFNELGKDEKRRAEKIFGKINEITTEDPEQRGLLFTYGVFAFEHLKAKKNLDALEGLSGENIVEFGRVFGDQDDLEASLYHQIVKGRLLVIRALQQHVEEDALEKVVQSHLFSHLWLLDPSWERATAEAYMEKQVSSEFEKVDKQLQGQDLGRVDIKYSTAAGTHVIVELKRASVVTETPDLIKQVDRYRVALHRLLESSGEHHPRIDTVCVVGKDLRDWKEPGGRQESARTLAGKNIRVVTYTELIRNAGRAYESFLEENKRAGRLLRLLDAIETDD